MLRGHNTDGKRQEDCADENMIREWQDSFCISAGFPAEIEFELFSEAFEDALGSIGATLGAFLVFFLSCADQVK